MKFLHAENFKLILDVGGNLGQTVASMRLFCRSSKIISFEPNAFLASRLKGRFLNDKAFEVEVSALSDRDGEFPLYIPVYKYITFPDLGTFDRSEAEELAGLPYLRLQ